VKIGRSNKNQKEVELMRYGKDFHLTTGRELPVQFCLIHILVVAVGIVVVVVVSPTFRTVVALDHSEFIRVKRSRHVSLAAVV